MKYTYVYKSSDGVRHESEMDACTRDAVFEALRAQGIRAIKVVAADGSKANGEARIVGVRKRIVFVFAMISAVVSALIALSIGRSESSYQIEVVNQRARRMVKPLPRMEIRGDRTHIDHPPSDLFSTPLETYLSKFAEPGRSTGTVAMPQLGVSGDADIKILERPIYVADGELTEYEELKRITLSIKLEMLNYIRGGGSREEYFQELVKRQHFEMACREKAEGKLTAMLADSVTSEQDAYDYWLKANARLQSMGIYSIPLPPILRSYQTLVDFDD